MMELFRLGSSQVLEGWFASDCRWQWCWYCLRCRWSYDSKKIMRNSTYEHPNVVLGALL